MQVETGPGLIWEKDPDGSSYLRLGYEKESDFERAKREIMAKPDFAHVGPEK